MVAFHQFLEAHLDLRPGGAGLKSERVERLALGVTDDAGFRALLLFPFCIFAKQVEWIEGDASALGTPEADLLVMTGNVAQIFLEDDDLRKTLTAIHAALHSGGYLAFESRNPQARAWEKWNREDSYYQFDSPHGSVESWVEVTHVEGSYVQFEGHNVFLSTGEVVIVESTLRFRSHEEIISSLTDCGFTVEHVYGDWDKNPFEEESRMMIFVAQR